MPSRNQQMIRRDINRLKDTLERHRETHKSLAAIHPVVSSAAESVNRSWQTYQASAVVGDKEREERDESIKILLDWIQSWRPIMLMLIPGASSNIRQLPPTGATPDDVIRVAEDMAELIKGNPGADSFREEALNALGEKIDAARKETSEASAALPAEAAARQAFSEATLSANTVLIPGTDAIRAIFGRTSPEYKQFIARDRASEEDDIDDIDDGDKPGAA